MATATRQFPLPAGGAGGASGTSQTSLDLTPSVNVTYTESGGVLSGTGGIFDGWSVAGWSDFTSLIEYDTGHVEWIISLAGDQRVGVAHATLNTCPQIYLPDLAVGDLTLDVKFSATAVGANDVNFNVGAWSPATTGTQTHGILNNFQWSTTNGRWNAYATARNGRLTTQQGSDKAWATQRWGRISRTDHDVTFAEKLDDGDAWTEIEENEWDHAGGSVRLGFLFGGNGTTGTLRIYKVAGAYYSSDDLA